MKSGAWAVFALTCCTLACKFLERDDDIPLIDDMIKAAGLSRKVTYEQVQRAEFQVCSNLEWQLAVVTPYDFVKNYLCQGVLLSSDLMEGTQNGRLQRPDKKTLLKVKRKI